MPLIMVFVLFWVDEKESGEEGMYVHTYIHSKHVGNKKKHIFLKDNLMLHRWDNVTYKSYLQGQLLFFFSASVGGGGLIYFIERR